MYPKYFVNGGTISKDTGPLNVLANHGSCCLDLRLFLTGRCEVCCNWLVNFTEIDAVSCCVYLCHLQFGGGGGV